MGAASTGAASAGAALAGGASAEAASAEANGWQFGDRDLERVMKRISFVVRVTGWDK